MRTNIYIDRFNLYHGCLKGTPHKWLDLAAFCRASFPLPRNQINRIRYFTAHLTARPNDPLQLRRHEGYDHGYYFISTFMQDHLVHHAKILQA